MRLARSGPGGRLCGRAGTRARGLAVRAAGDVECLEQAVRRRALDRALRTTVGDDEVAAVRARLAG